MVSPAHMLTQGNNQTQTWEVNTSKHNVSTVGCSLVNTLYENMSCLLHPRMFLDNICSTLPIPAPVKRTTTLN